MFFTSLLLSIAVSIDALGIGITKFVANVYNTEETEIFDRG